LTVIAVVDFHGENAHGCASDYDWSLTMNTSPLDNIEHAYLRYAYGPDAVQFWGGYTTGLPAQPYSLPEISTLLTARKTPDDLKDKIWSSLVKMARTNQKEWSVIAAGIAIRALRKAVKRAHSYAPGFDIQDDLESAAISAFIEAIPDLDLATPQICGRLCQAAFVKARQYALDLKQYQETMVSGVFESHPPPDEEKHVDRVLLHAVEEGIITLLQAALICRTRLEQYSLRDITDLHGLDYRQCLRKRNEAEQELWEWLTGRDRRKQREGRDEGPA
jgi:hypothetical protein